MKKTFVLLIIFSLVLCSCSSPVNYTVDKEHEPKIQTIQKMVLSLLENDSDSYIQCFEPNYIENVRKSIDTLGFQYYGAKNFEDFIKSFLTQNKNDLNHNYGNDITVDLSFNSVENIVLEDKGIFTDDYSIGYNLPFENISSSVKVSTKIFIKGNLQEYTTNATFVLLHLSNLNWYIHPDTFLFTI